MNMSNLLVSLQQEIKYTRKNKSVLDESDPRDLIDHYLLEIRRGREGFNKDELYGIIFDLFAAGSETTSTTLRYIL